MRVAVDLTAIWRLETGVERVALGSFRALADHCHDFDLVVFARPQIARQLTDTTAKIVATPQLTRAGRVLWQQAWLPFLIRRYRIDMLWSPVYTAPLVCPCPVILLVHDVITFEHPELCTLRNRLHFRILLGAGVRRAWRVVVPSKAVAEAVVERLRPSAEPAVVPPGLGARFLSEQTSDEIEAARQALRLPDRFVLAVGRLEPKKNLPTVVRAFSHLSDSEVEDLSLVIVGAGGPGASETFRAIRASPARERIHHFSQVTESELACLYQLADCLAFPSFAEGFGIPPMESLALGTPPLVSKYTPSYVERWGTDECVFSNLEPAAVAQTIKDAVGSGRAKAHIDLKRSEARELTWKNHASKLSEIMRSEPGC